MNSAAPANLAAALTSSSVAPGRPYRMWSLTVTLKIKGDCETYEIPCRKLSIEKPCRAWPSIVIRPLDGSRSRGNKSTRVDFPAPDGPTSAIICPASIAKSMSRRALTTWSPRYSKVTSSNRRLSFMPSNVFSPPRCSRAADISSRRRSNPRKLPRYPKIVWLARTVSLAIGSNRIIAITANKPTCSKDNPKWSTPT